MLIQLNNTITESTAIKHLGGELQIAATGTFDGATLKMKISQDDLDYIELDDFSMTKDDVLYMSMKPNTDYIIFLDTVGASTNLWVSVYE